jgi:hypothetical protein
MHALLHGGPRTGRARLASRLRRSAAPTAARSWLGTSHPTARTPG